MQPLPDLLLTADGSHTLISPVFGEHYHSRHGAIQESIHVFIDAGLRHFSGRPTLHILEMGLGTGLNALLTLDQSLRSGQQIHYSAYETHPVAADAAAQLNYAALIDPARRDDLQNYLQQLHSSAWNTEVSLHPHFQLLKWNRSIEAMQTEDTFDLVYFDAFAPATQPQLWQEPLLARIFASMRSGAVLTTYCAQGAFKRALRAVGFEVEGIPGPPGKREMTRAFKA